MSEVYLSRDGLEKLKDELRELKEKNGLRFVSHCNGPENLVIYLRMLNTLQQKRG